MKYVVIRRQIQKLIYCVVKNAALKANSTQF